MTDEMSTQCEGWKRRGGVFTFGPVQWTQCPNDAIVRLTVKQKEGNSIQPACLDCWNEGKEFGIEILYAEPIAAAKGESP